MLESEYSRKWSKRLKEQGAKVLALTPEGIQEPGWPDRLIWDKRIGHMALECKKYDRKESAIQEMNLRDLRARGFIALACRYVPDNDKVVFDAGGLQIGNASLSEFLKNPLEILLQIKELYERACIKAGRSDPGPRPTGGLQW